MPVFGLIVAGDYDGKALGKLLSKLRPDLDGVIVRLCRDDYRVGTTFRNFLTGFEFAKAGHPVDKAIVVRDAHQRTAQESIRLLESGFDHSRYSFPVEFAAVAPELEAWLLADHGARTELSHERGQRHDYPPLDRSPEALHDPKTKLSTLLSDAGIGYTAAVAARLAELSDPAIIGGLCPSFALFKRAAEHC